MKIAALLLLFIACFFITAVFPVCAEDGSPLLTQAQDAIRQGNWSRAVEMLVKAKELLPADVHIRVALMDIYRACDMPLEEVITGCEILAIDPENIDTLKRLAHCYRSLGLLSREEEVRRRITVRDPSDYDNFRRLGEVLDRSGNVWEEIRVYQHIAEKFPGRSADSKRLAYLYGRDGDSYRQLMTYRQILAREQRNYGLKNAYHQVYRDYKREQGLPDQAYLDLHARQDSYPLNTQYESGVDAAYQRVFLFEGGSIGFELSQRNIMYVAAANTQQVGDARVASTYYGLSWESAWKGDKNRLSLRGGLLSVDASNSVKAAPGVTLSPSEYPWMGTGRIGGGVLVYSADYTARLSRGLKACAFFRRGVVEDLDAYVRLITRAGYGASVSYTAPDGTSLAGSVEWAHLSDNNNHHSAQARFEYPLWVSGALYDLEHARKGYVRSIPDSSLRIGYEVEFQNDDFISPYYRSFKNEWESRTLIAANLKVARNLFLTGTGSLGYGQTLEYARRCTVGLLHSSHEGSTRVELNYVTGEEFLKPGTQLNKTIEGERATRLLELKSTWRF